ncbi:MAG: phosphatidate cytidylyltransferase [Nitrospirota bacterium]|nr:phosphatidate cytidylyltransferase [Nitrospirota bacterium]
MHSKRWLAALVFLPVFYLVVSSSSSVPFFIVAAIACALGQWEFYRMCDGGPLVPLRITGVVAGLVLLFTFQAGCGDAAFLPLMTAIFLALGTIRLFADRDTRGALLEIAVTFAGVVYVAGLLGHLILLRGMEQGGHLIFLLFLATWAGDTGAYYAGRSLGRHKLYEKISPKKTREGAIGGLLASIGAVLIAKFWFLPELSVGQCVVLGCLLGVSGQIGDLVESLIKRSLSVKDSGSIIPGHGGILDRVDSLLFSGPVLYYYLKYL